MKTRKIVLLSAIGALTLIYALQLISLSKTDTKVFKLDKVPDCITWCVPEKEEVKISFNGSEWIINDSELKADDKTAGQIVDALTKIKTLGITAKSSDDADRYGLNEGHSVKVTARAGDTLLRTVYIGKTASASSQSYIKIDNGKEIYLCTGSLNSIFEKTAEDIKADEKSEDASSDIQQ